MVRAARPSVRAPAHHGCPRDPERGTGRFCHIVAGRECRDSFGQGTLFPVFQVSSLTMALQLLAALVVGTVAAAWPAWRMSRIDIVAGLRHVG